MGRKYINENYVHNCDEPRVNLIDHAASIFEMGYSTEEQVRIVDFYLFHAPLLKAGTADDKFGLRSLRSYGWHGNAAMSRLESLLLKDAGITFFCFLKSDSINNTLESMNLGEKLCIAHPRAVLRQNASVSVREDGSVFVSQRETRMECLFRHIRNSIAHNHTYYFGEENILLEDCSDSGSISARLLIPKKALLYWADTVETKALQ